MLHTNYKTSVSFTRVRKTFFVFSRASVDANNSLPSFHLNNIRSLGRLFEFDYEEEIDLSNFQTLLDAFELEGQHYNTTEHMRKVYLAYLFL